MTFSIYHLQTEQTLFEVVELQPMVCPLQADHHGEGKHHLSRVDLVDGHDGDVERHANRSIRIVRIGGRVFQVCIRNNDLQMQNENL